MAEVARSARRRLRAAVDEVAFERRRLEARSRPLTPERNEASPPLPPREDSPAPSAPDGAVAGRVVRARRAARDPWWVRNELTRHAALVQEELSPLPRVVRRRFESGGINEAWLRHELELHCSVTAVSSQHGLSEEAVASAIERFDIDVEAEYEVRRDACLTAIVVEGLERRAAAERFGLPEETVRFWCTEVAAGRLVAAPRVDRYLPRPSRSRNRPPPPYKDEAWLRAELGKYGSYTAVGRAHGLHLSTLCRAGRSFGIDVLKEYGHIARRPRATARGAKRDCRPPLGAAPARRKKTPASRSYHDEGWLRGQLEKHRTYAAVAKATGLPAKRLAEAGRHFGIDVRRDYPRPLAPPKDREHTKRSLSRSDERRRPRGPAPVLPLEETWLRRELEKYCALTPIALKYSLELREVVAAAKSFGINVQREYWAKRAQFLDLLKSSGLPLDAAAQEVGVSPKAARFWLRR